VPLARGFPAEGLQTRVVRRPSNGLAPIGGRYSMISRIRSLADCSA
jgi:hypothetical protein